MAHAVLKAINIANCSQTTFAEKIGSDLDMVNSWINRGIKVPLHYAFAIDSFTQGKVTWKEVSPHLVHFEKLWDGLRLIPQFFPLKSIQIPLSQIQYEVATTQENLEDTSDIQSLAEHIKQFGLQHPIGIDTEKRLLFGRKRLLAYQLLGKETIECWSISLLDILTGQYKSKVLCHYFRFSERLQVSFALQKFIRTPQGQRKNCSIQHENVEAKGRSDELIAKLLGFRSRYTYTQAKRVYARRSQWLIDALDAERLILPDALCLISLSDEKLKQILNQSDQEILDFIQQIKSSQQRQAKSAREKVNS